MSTTQGENGVYKTTLKNGLEVRLKEIHTAPLISSWIWYRVGSRNERAGTTGVSHWVEHMQFKGTPKFPAQVLDKMISRVGGMWNAFTWIDWTTYFETLPADHVELAFQLEADRMVNSLFDPKEVDSERTVIISERQGHENEPTFRLAEEVQAAAFRVHSYHHEVIGDMADLENMRREDLYNHYQQFYTPSNAVLAVAGKFNTSALLAQIREIFGGLEKRPKPDTVVRPEPAQHGERQVAVEGPGETAYVQIAYHIPGAFDDDFVVLSVLDSVLAGASNLNFFGGSISNKTSRLYKRLVEGELCASVTGSLAASIDPYLYTLRATVRPDRDPGEVLEAFDIEIERLLHAPIQSTELEKAIKQARALFAYSSESITNQGFWMGYVEMFADYPWFDSFLDRLSQVTAEQALEAAQRYLLPKNRVVGIYYPSGGKSDA